MYVEYACLVEVLKKNLPLKPHIRAKCILSSKMLRGYSYSISKWSEGNITDSQMAMLELALIAKFNLFLCSSAS